MLLVLTVIADYEWQEDATDFSITSVYEEVSDLSKTINSMRKDLQLITEIQEKINADKKAAEDALEEEKKNRPSSRARSKTPEQQRSKTPTRK